ncbi:MAG: hypothetical protein JO091_02825 [Acidobacteriaceae bacterium]|nr:hypothetical protein [Acidobacteriaceae bacterium]
MRFCFPFLTLLAVTPVCAQLKTTLPRETAEQFEQYARAVEQQLETRWHSPGAFSAIDVASQDRAAVMRGEVLIHPATAANPVAVTGGLIHDWIAIAFFPSTTLSRVVDVLQDYNAHKTMYRNIIDSRLLHRDNKDVTGYWRLAWNHPFLHVVLDAEQEAHYEEIGPDKWICRAYIRNTSEVENPGTPSEKKLPPGEGRGFLWRMYAYWSLEAANGGVFAECRTLSLSRNIPRGLAWAIGPFVGSIPRESLSSTMLNTRKAATK